MAEKNLKLGDTVQGFYRDVPFVGVIVGFDMHSGGISIDLTEKISLFGTDRDGVWIDADARRHTAKLTLVKAGPDLSETDVVNCQGHYVLRK